MGLTNRKFGLIEIHQSLGQRGQTDGRWQVNLTAVQKEPEATSPRQIPRVVGGPHGPTGRVHCRAEG